MPRSSIKGQMSSIIIANTRMPNAWYPQIQKLREEFGRSISLKVQRKIEEEWLHMPLEEYLATRPYRRSVVVLEGMQKVFPHLNFPKVEFADTVRVPVRRRTVKEPKITTHISIPQSVAAQCKENAAAAGKSYASYLTDIIVQHVPVEDVTKDLDFDTDDTNSISNT